MVHDTVLMWDLLVRKQGFDPDKVYFLYSGGMDYPLRTGGANTPDQYWMDYEEYSEYGYSYELEDFKQLVYSSASRENIESLFDSLSTNNVMTEDDFLFVSTLSHGGYEGANTNEGLMLIWDDDPASYPTISDNDFADIIREVPANKKVFWLGQCHSGNFVDDLESMIDGSHKIVNAACLETESTRPCDDKAWPEQSVMQGRGTEMEHLFDDDPLFSWVTHDEFPFHMYTSTSGVRPFAFDDVRPEIAEHPYEYQKPSATADYEWFNIMEETDKNNDGVISVVESEEWYSEYNTRIDEGFSQTSVPSDLDNVGDYTSLLYPTLIFDNYADYRLRGLMGISADLEVVNKDLVLIDNSHTTLLEGRKVNIRSGYNLIVKSGAVLKLTDASEIVIEFGGSFIIEPGAIFEIEGSARIIGDIQLADGVSINISENSILNFQLGKVTIQRNTALKFDNNSKLIIENGTDFTIAEGAVIELAEGAEIVVMNKGKMIAVGTNFSYVDASGNWEGITAEVGSTVTFSNTSISNAVLGLYAEASDVNIESSSFTDCENGVSLVNCEDYTLNNNYFYGKAIGTGITLTHCSKPINDNFVSNFTDGVILVTSSVTLARNTIYNNNNTGLYVTGYGRVILVDTVSKESTTPPPVPYPIPYEKGINNDIIDNGLNSLSYARAQIQIRFPTSVYMTNGFNNVYSGAIGSIPTVPCIKGITQLTNGGLPAFQLIIAAEENYWGYSGVNDGNQGNFFSFAYNPWGPDTGYSIDYEPYNLVPYVEDIQSSSANLSSNEPPSRETTLLYNAMRLEQDDKYTPSINLYEKVIDEYPDSEEYYVAISRLPYVYEEANKSLDPLIKTYDEALASDETINKKFFKEMKVLTKIKDKKYDVAIVLAEDMKAEAITDEEKLLSDIDIAICNMMLNANSKGKSGNSSTVSDLLARLNGNEEEGEKTDIVESQLPSEISLYQNYPNPFNPTTEIRFALPTVSDVKLNVFNINGQLISELVNGSKEAGIHKVNFDASNYNSGMYFYTLEANGMSMTKKMILTK
jgi:tetratricopeptide (TPR) repeat protein